MSIGRRVRAKRKALKMSQETLAHKAGITLNSVGALERGQAHDPHYSTLAGLAAALDTSVAALVGEEPVPTVELSGSMSATGGMEGRLTVGEQIKRAFTLLKREAKDAAELAEIEDAERQALQVWEAAA